MNWLVLMLGGRCDGPDGSLAGRGRRISAIRPVSISKPLPTLSALCLVMAVMLVPAAPARAAEATPLALPVQALQRLYEREPEFRASVDRAFANLRDADPATRDLWPHPGAANPWKGKGFADLLAFFDDWYRLLPEPGGARDEFNYIERFAWFYHRNPDGQRLVGTEPGLGWTRDFVAARGRFLDSGDSTAVIHKWTNDAAVRMGDYLVPPEGFKSFNQFFIRDLKPGARTVASPDDDAVLVAPTDCVLAMIQPLAPDRRIPTKLGQKLDVKALLDSSGYAKYFENGSAVSCILLPSTYHHYHAVAAGKVVEAREDVAGSYHGINDFGAFFNAGNIGQGASYSAFEHFRRGYLVIETPEYGHVAMIPVGLDTVGSVVFEDRFKRVMPDRPEPVRKGEKLGHFAYGGSLVITLIERDFSPQERAPDQAPRIPLGQKIGVFKEKPSSALR